MQHATDLILLANTILNLTATLIRLGTRTRKDHKDSLPKDDCQQVAEPPRQPKPYGPEE
jgi:hypothetical protein